MPVCDPERKKPSLLSSSVEIDILQSVRSLQKGHCSIAPHLFHFFLPTHDFVCRLFSPNGMTAKFCVCMIRGVGEARPATLELEAFLLRCMTLEKNVFIAETKGKVQ